MKHTPKDEVLGRIEAQGPCTLDQLCWSVKEQEEKEVFEKAKEVLREAFVTLNL